MLFPHSPFQYQSHWSLTPSSLSSNFPFSWSFPSDTKENSCPDPYSLPVSCYEFLCFLSQSYSPSLPLPTSFSLEYNLPRLTSPSLHQNSFCPGHQQRLGCQIQWPPATFMISSSTTLDLDQSIPATLVFLLCPEHTKHVSASRPLTLVPLHKMLFFQLSSWHGPSLFGLHASRPPY